MRRDDSAAVEDVAAAVESLEQNDLAEVDLDTPPISVNFNADPLQPQQAPATFHLGRLFRDLLKVKYDNLCSSVIALRKRLVDAGFG